MAALPKCRILSEYFGFFLAILANYNMQIRHIRNNDVIQIYIKQRISSTISRISDQLVLAALADSMASKRATVIKNYWGEAIHLVPYST